ncbi:hypothetical protein [Paenibacillus sp. HB172176]|uniref:hypothetical protein n=1 Tax=Paenibacillus sp. HB172176 TaxID=2493690 RepID=UPI00143C363B|nr:hypothetical protein [Paenibacillus sp. HB172176]
MEAQLNKLIQLSSNLIEKMESSDLQSIEEYMTQRDKLFADLQQLPVERYEADALQPLIERITKQDSVIIRTMAALKHAAFVEIEKINRGKRSKSVYESSSYGDDSLFFDRRR